MLRTIGGAILGYLVMGVTVFLGLTVAYLALGADRAFREGVYQVSPLWAVLSLVVGLGAAAIGGLVARRVASTAHGPLLLAGLVLVLGLAMAVPVLLADPAAAGAVDPSAAIRPDGLGPMEAMQHARTPAWLALLNPLVGVVGVLLGGLRHR